MNKEQVCKQIKELFEREKQHINKCRQYLYDIIKNDQIIDIDESYVELTPTDSFDGLPCQIDKN